MFMKQIFCQKLIFVAGGVRKVLGSPTCCRTGGPRLAMDSGLHDPKGEGITLGVAGWPAKGQCRRPRQRRTPGWALSFNSAKRCYVPSPIIYFLGYCKS